MNKPSSVSVLPDALVARFKAWRQDDFDAQHFAELAEGQSPMAMVISCCDSRVQSSEIFDVPAGSFFIHRNIANLVPPPHCFRTFHSTLARRRMPNAP